MSYAPALVLRDGDRKRLGDLTRLPGVPSGLSKRARIILLAADGVPNAEIARKVGVSRPTVLAWRDRYAAGGIAALDDAPRSGRPAEIDEIEIVTATLVNDGRPPGRLGITHWSARFLASELGISFATVARVWRKWGVQPHRVETFKFSTDPALAAKIRDVVGLYLAPPDSAVVVSVDERSQAQVLGRTQPRLALRPGLPERRTNDQYLELLRFLNKVAASHPNAELHVVLDNDGTHDYPQVRKWLAEPDNQRITLHFTPAGCSWLNMVEIFFGITTVRQAMRRGAFRSVKDLIAATGTFIGAYNDRCEPFTWIKHADELIAKSDRQRTSDTRH